MNRFYLASASFALLAALVPATIASAVVMPNSMAPTPSSAALRFGEVYLALDITLEAALAGFDKEFKPAMEGNANIIALEKAKPGLLVAVSKAGRDAMATAFGIGIAAAQKRLTAFAVVNFSEAELSDINTYLASDAGKRLQKLTGSATDTSEISKKARETGTIPKFSGTELVSMVDPMLLSQLDNADMATFVSFSMTPGGKKLNALGPQLADLVADEMNKIVVAMKPEVERAIVAAMKSHLNVP